MAWEMVERDKDGNGDGKKDGKTDCRERLWKEKRMAPRIIRKMVELAMQLKVNCESAWQFFGSNERGCC